MDVTGSIIGFLVVWAAGGLALGLFAKHKNRRALAWGVIGGFPNWVMFAALGLSVKSFLCVTCKTAMTGQERKAGNCPKCGPSTGTEPATVGGLAATAVRWRWPVLGAMVLVIVMTYMWSTGRVRDSVVGFCDSVVVGDPVKGIEQRARTAGLRAFTSPAGVDVSGRPHDGYVYVRRSSIFFYVYNCWIKEKDGKAIAKQAAGGAL